MAIVHPMTPEEVKNNYEFKVSKRALMNELKWIKDVRLVESDLVIYNTIFVDLVIDPILLANQYDWILNIWVTPNYRSSTPSMFFDITYEEGVDKVVNPIDKILDDVHRSNAIPQEMKLPNSRPIRVGDYYIPE
jgi:hypothetical protein